MPEGRLRLTKVVHSYFASWMASSHVTSSFSSGEDERIGGPRLPGSRSWEDASIRVSDQVPLERSGNFPQNYTDSSHRRDWFQVISTQYFQRHA